MMLPLKDMPTRKTDESNEPNLGTSQPQMISENLNISTSISASLQSHKPTSLSGGFGALLKGDVCLHPPLGDASWPGMSKSWSC